MITQGEYKAPSAANGTIVDRIQPSKYSRIHYHLKCLVNGLRKAVDEHIRHADYTDLLDYGCGEMPYRSLFDPYITKYRGCDLAGNALADFDIDAEGNLPIAEASTDVVLSTQVLEHVLKPSSYLSECRRVIRPGGRLILTTHGVWQFHPVPLDMWRWTSQGLPRVVEQAGFEVLSIEGIMAPTSYALQLIQDANAYRFPKRLRPYYFRLMQFAIAFADSRSQAKQRQRDACAYIVVAGPTT